MIIVAGPNGSGKSTLVRDGRIAELFQTPEAVEPVEVLNPDRLAAELRASGVLDADTRAANETEQRTSRNIESGRSFLIETVLSTPKYRQNLLNAITLDYWVFLYYIYLQNPDLHIARVAQRERLGGHGVPDDKVRARWVRSFEQFSWFAQHAHVVRVFDNSLSSYGTQGPKLVGERSTDGPLPSRAGWRLYSGLKQAPKEFLAALNTAVDS